MNAGERFSWQQWLILLVAFASILITASLGAWQLRRAAYKEQLSTQINERNQLIALTNTTLNASDFIAPTQKEETWLQRRAELQGRWLHAHTVFLDNRPMQISSNAQGSQRVGFYVATPLALEGSNRVIWVQRGWVPRDFQDRTRLPTLPENSEIVSVQGRLIASISKAYEMKDSEASNSPAGNPRPSRIWQNIPTVVINSKTLLPMALLQTEPDSDQDSLQRNWPAANTGVAKHYGYAFQWFALSVLLMILYVWFQLIAPRRKKHV